MELKQLIHFLEVCKTKNFTRAAEHCYISPQGISISVARLEAELGVKLFTRTSQGVIPTEHGYYLIPKATEITKIAGECTEHFENYLASINSVSVVFIRGTVELMGMGSIAGFKNDHPELGITFQVESDKTAEDMVLNYKADMALCSGPVTSKDLSKKLVFTARNMLVVGTDHPLALKSSVSIEDLKDIQLSLPREDVAITKTVLELCDKKGFTPRYIQNDEPRMAFQCAEMGLGAGIVNEISAKKLANPRVKLIPFSTEAMNWNVYLIKRKNDNLSTTAEIFEKYLLQAAKKVAK